MKKVIIALTLALACHAAQAQTIEHLFNTFKGKQNVEFVPINKEMLQMVLQQAGEQAGEQGGIAEVMAIFKHIDSINVLSLEEAATDLQDEFVNTVSTLDLDGYEKLIDVMEDKEQTVLYAKKDGQTIKELLVFMIEPRDPGLVQIIGNLRTEDIEKMMQHVGN